MSLSRSITYIRSHIFGQSFCFSHFFSIVFNDFFSAHFYFVPIFSHAYTVHTQYRMLFCIHFFHFSFCWSATIYKFNDKRLFTRKAKLSLRFFHVESLLFLVVFFFLFFLAGVVVVVVAVVELFSISVQNPISVSF